MSEKLRDYQVLDVLCGGTFYKVRHKVTNDIFAWKAYDCSAQSNEQIQNVVREVKTLSKLKCDGLLRYYDTILHAPSRTLYIVLEHSSWQSLEDLIGICETTDKYFVEGFIWHLLLELARVCKVVEGVGLRSLRGHVSAASVLVGERCELRVDCWRPDKSGGRPSLPLVRQLGIMAQLLCYRHKASQNNMPEYQYSDDLRDVIGFLTDNRSVNLRLDVLLYHPTVLSNIETLPRPKHISNILVAAQQSLGTSEVNKCDSEKAVELCRKVEPLPRTHINLFDSPIYSNISPKYKHKVDNEQSVIDKGSLSPTLAALALELPGFVPRCRKPVSQALERYNPQKVSQETLSGQWMTRLIALRQREESLNKREMDLLSKEIENSPSVKIIPLNETLELQANCSSNGITLPPVLSKAEPARRRHRRTSSIRTRNRRKTFGYEDLDSSLSADPGDGSMIVTATKFTKENMPRRNIFPEVSSKKVHFTSSNPFVESDESVTLTFYELDNTDKEGYQMPLQEEKLKKDITKFKYLDIEKITSEKRAAMQWSQSSPSKQAKITKSAFADLTNSIRKTPSKSSLASKGSNSSRYSMMSCNSEWKEVSIGKMSDSHVSGRTRSNIRQSMAVLQTPIVPPEVKKSKRKSLLPFKTPFKFMTSTKI